MGQTATKSIVFPATPNPHRNRGQHVCLGYSWVVLIRIVLTAVIIINTQARTENCTQGGRQNRLLCGHSDHPLNISRHVGEGPGWQYEFRLFFSLSSAAATCCRLIACRSPIYLISSHGVPRICLFYMAWPETGNSRTRFNIFDTGT
jgi:hypothetical protein